MKILTLVCLTVIAIVSIDGYVNGKFSYRERSESARLHALVEEHRFDEAEAALDKFIQEYPYSEGAYADLAAVEAALGHPERVQSLLITARTLQFSPRVKEAFFENWRTARDVLIVVLITELLYVGYTSLRRRFNV